MNTFAEFIIGTFVLVFRGGKKYYAWMAALALIAMVGLGAWVAHRVVRWLFACESRWPTAMGIRGAYPLIVIHKPASAPTARLATLRRAA